MLYQTAFRQKTKPAGFLPIIDILYLVLWHVLIYETLINLASEDLLRLIYKETAITSSEQQLFY